MFKIKHVYKKQLPEYTIQDLQSEDIIDKFLDHELQAVSKEDEQTYKLKKVVRTKGKESSKEFLMSWEGF